MIFSDLKLDKNKFAYSHCLKNDTNVAKHLIEFIYFCKMIQRINNNATMHFCLVSFLNFFQKLKWLYKPPIPILIILISMTLSENLSGQTPNCGWEFKNEQDCEHWVAPGYVCDTANQNDPNDFLYHHHSASPQICIFPYNTCGSWSTPSIDSFFFDCGYCGQTPLQNCTNVSNFEAKYYVKVNTILSIQTDQYAFDWRTVETFLTDFQHDLPDTYCCDLTSGPDVCVNNNCSAPEIDWENNKIYLHGAYQPYYQNCINWP